MAKISDIHIGEEIDRRIHELNMSYSDVARQLHVDRTTIYSIVKSKSLDTVRLVNLSNILNFDFFSLYEPFIFSHSVQPCNVRQLMDYIEAGNSVQLSLTLKNKSWTFPRHLWTIHTQTLTSKSTINITFAEVSWLLSS